MIDIKTMQESFLCERLSKLIAEKNDLKWTWIPSIHLRYFGKEFACLSSTVGHKKFKGIHHIQSVYWKKAVINWLTLNNKAPFFQTEKICIWNNSSITHQNNVLMFENWIDKLTYVIS